MCGVAGVIAWNKPIDENMLRKMGDLLFHQGPSRHLWDLWNYGCVEVYEN